MSIDDGIEILTSLFFEKDWFVEVEIDKLNRYVVYVSAMNAETMATIPDQMLGRSVVSHFIASKPKQSAISEDDQEYDLPYLMGELARYCGDEDIECIFFECHDGENAVSNKSELHPDARIKMQKLYDIYGFDLIFDHLEGRN